MKNIFLPILLISIIFTGSCVKKQEVAITSPGKNIRLTFGLTDGKPFYMVNHKETICIDTSFMGFHFKDMKPMNDDFLIVSSKSHTVNNTWEPVWGESNKITNHYNEVIVYLQEKNTPNRLMNIIFRVYDDGIGFRYEFPVQDAFDNFAITDEKTEFSLTDNHKTWWIPAHYDSYEMLYNTTTLSEIEQLIKNNQTLSAKEIYMKKKVRPVAVSTPVTIKTTQGLYLSFHEANLTDYAGMKLKIKNRDGKYTFESDLVPWPDGIKVIGKTPFKTPWRTIQINNNPGGLITSNLIVNLNEPCAIEDVSWIEPMKYMGIWWGYHIGKYSFDYPGTKEKPHGATTENAKLHIDFATKHGIKGLLIEGWNTKLIPEKTPDTDISNVSADLRDYTRPHPDFNLHEVTRYAKKNDVNIIIHNETMGQAQNYDNQLDTAYKLYKSLDINAIKTGYAWFVEEGKYYHHSQWMVRHYNKVIKKAAEYKIMLNVHEPIKATGLRRTYPNMLTREGVRGNEYNAWVKAHGNPPEHTTIIPFTRMLAGPVDFTPGIFDLTFNQYRDEQRVNTTLAKQLALFVVIYSPMQMAADLPENYKDNPAFSFIEQVPVDWDDTKVLHAAIGDYIAITRRKDENWHLGCITDEQARTLKTKLDFLEKGKDYLATIYADAEDTDLEKHPEKIRIFKQQVNRDSELTINMKESGGMAVVFEVVE